MGTSNDPSSRATPAPTGNASAHNPRAPASGVNNNRRNRNRPRGNGGGFRGNTDALNGNVFQTYAEQQRKSGQFTSTMAALQTYVARHFRDDAENLQTLFDDDIRHPSLPKPVRQAPQVRTEKVKKEGTVDEYEEIETDDRTPDEKQVDDMIFTEQIKQYVKNNDRLKSSERAIFDIIWGQCSRLTQTTIKADESYADIKKSGDAARLLKIIRLIGNQVSADMNIYDAYLYARANLDRYYQNDGVDLSTHLKNFKYHVECVEQFGAGYFESTGLMVHEWQQDTEANRKANEPKHYKKVVRDKLVVVLFMKKANYRTYQPLIDDLRDQHLFKKDMYPTTLQESFTLLKNHSSARRSNNNRQRTGSQDEDNVIQGMQHAQSQCVAGCNGRTFPNAHCNICNNRGHIATYCPNAQRNNAVNTADMAAGANRMHLASIEEQGDTTPSDTNDTDPPNITSDIQDDAIEPDNINIDSTNAETSDDDNDREVIVSFQGLYKHSLPNCNKDHSILIDTGPTYSVFRNSDMLTDITKSHTTMRAYSNGGFQDSTMTGVFADVFKVWYNPKSLLNILAFSDVRKKFRITCDTDISNSTTVHISDNETWNFIEIHAGLYIRNTHNDNIKHDFAHYSHLTLINDLRSIYSRRELALADKARQLYISLGRPGYLKFKHLIRTTYIRNCPITMDDIQRLIHIYGPDPSNLAGRGTRPTPLPLAPLHVTALDAVILRQHPTVSLCADYFFVNSIPFLHTYSENFCFRTCEPLRNKRKANKTDTVNGLRSVVRLYTTRGLSIQQINADNEFDCVRNELLPVPFNIVAAHEHVGPVERSIRTIKDDVRTLIDSLPFTKYPTELTIGAVLSCIRKRNQLPADNGVSATVSPATLITGSAPFDFNSLAKLDFGDYVHVREDTTNDMRPRSIPALALYPSGNTGGGWYFLSLLTGRCIHRCHYTTLPAPNDIVQRVEQLANAQITQPVTTNGLSFEWTPGTDIEDQPYPDPNNEHAIEPYHDEYDDADAPDLPPIPPEQGGELQLLPALPAPQIPETQGAHTTSNDQDQGALINQAQGAPILHEQAPDDRNADGNHDHRVDDDMDGRSQISDDDNPHADQADDTQHDVDDESVTTTDTTDGSTQRDAPHMNLRQQPRIDYGDLHRSGHQQYTQIIQKHKRKKKRNKTKINIKDTFRMITKTVMHQMNKIVSEHDQLPVHTAINRFGQKAIDAVLKEYAQLHDMSVFAVENAMKLTAQAKRRALNLITKVKLKRCGKVKARGCADGRKQRLYIRKEQVTSPTVQLESLIVTMLMDAHQHRDVATADISGAFLRADMKEFTLVRITGDSVNILCEVHPEYKQHVTIEKGKQVLYVRLRKALYGCMQSALLWYEVFSDKLIKEGFRLNPYEPCVANKNVNGSQCTIAWYVDDTKISHKDPKVVSQIINMLESSFDKMSVKRGREHTFVGMNFNLRDDGKLEIRMKEYIEECINVFNEDLNKTAKTPGRHNLFGEDPPELASQLNEEMSERFHHIVSKLLYVSKRARPDIDLTIAYLCTRVSKSTEGDWQKLRRLVQYLKNTIDLPRIIGMDGSSNVYTWVDASYAVHNDMRGHTGGVTSMGEGIIHQRTAKQKLNTKSSTESEIVGASEYLPWCLWLQYFMKAQGYKINKNIFYQDNESAIKLEKNGKSSSTDRTRHINIRYFFITDVIKREDIYVEHCHTTRMLADYFTKPLQGSLFKNYRNAIMGLSPLPFKERVENPVTNHTNITNLQVKGTVNTTQHYSFNMGNLFT